MEGNERNMEEIGGRTQSWENLQERARLSAILWAPRGEIILGVLEMPGTLKNESGQLITKLAQKLARINKKQMKPKHFPLIPTMANGTFFGRK